MDVGLLVGWAALSADVIIRNTKLITKRVSGSTVVPADNRDVNVAVLEFGNHLNGIWAEGVLETEDCARFSSER